jgi:hypothetical protein
MNVLQALKRNSANQIIIKPNLTLLFSMNVAYPLKELRIFLKEGVSVALVFRKCWLSKLKST